jgi:redox-sensitive bicupin YhaK (pirin superfamily)
VDGQVEVRRSAQRYLTRTGWLETRHSLAGGLHYDPTNTSFGALVLHDEHRVAPGAGFDDHRHRGVEVVTWVLDGVLRHRDDRGHEGLVVPGQVQRLRAGSGVVHSERNDSADAPLRFVQAWLLDDPDAAPQTDVADVAGQLADGGLVRVAGGPGAAVPLAVDGASLHVGRLVAGDQVLLPTAPRLHVHVTAGHVDLDGAGALEPGDAARLTAPAACRLRATTPAEVLVWALP